MNKRIAVLIAAIAGTLALAPTAWAQNPPAVPTDAPYATVNGKTITQKEFQIAYNAYLREKYFHQQVPEGGLAAAKLEVDNRLIDRILLLDEAKRRGLVADAAAIATAIAGYEAQYAQSQVWQSRRESLLPGLKQQLAEQDLLHQIETIGHAVTELDEAAVRAFYQARLELFTEPEKQHLHTILLKVDPAAPKALWDAAREEAARIVARLRSGADKFEDLASLHSQDNSADQGGDMGYLHRGMIPEAVQTQLDERPLGVVGDPIDVLEGVAIFRLDERVAAKVMDFDAVAARARDLLKRERSAQAWDKFVADLRVGATITPAVPSSQAKN